MEQALLRWMVRAGTVNAREASAHRTLSDKLEKALGAELRDLILAFGLRQTIDAANRSGAEIVGARVVPPGLYADAVAGKPVKIKYFQRYIDGIEVRTRSIMTETRDLIRDEVKRIMADAQSEDPRPSAGEIARRIRTTIMAPDPRNRAYVFSPERAAVIARTELGQAENTGTFGGYQLTGVKRIEWLAVTADRKSGERRHWEMDGVQINIGDKFVLPSGAQLRYPGDPSGPISETVQCRCTMKPVAPPRKKE